MRVTGLEPARITPPDPKSGVFANFTIPAYRVIFYIKILNNASYLKIFFSNAEKLKYHIDF